jgi:hypothetical protein
VELHMLLGSLRRGKNIEGFLSGGLVDPQRIFVRHQELAAEMTRRGFKHNSPIDEHECAILAAGYADCAAVDTAANAHDLRQRCPDCAALMAAK